MILGIIPHNAWRKDITMSGDEKPKKRIRGLLSVAISLATLVVLTYIAVTLISGREFFFMRFIRNRVSSEPMVIVDEYSFEVGRARVFADLGETVAAVGTLGVQVLDLGGNELLRDPFRLTSPAIDVSGNKAIAFDIGGTAVRVINDAEFSASFDTEAAIISASVNENGWFCVCVRDDSGYKCAATVYNNLGKEEYKVRMASGYILSSILSKDNRRLAVLSLTEGGSKIAFYELSKEDVDRTFLLPDRLIIDIQYLPSGDLLAVTTESLVAVDKNGGGKELHWFAGKRLGNYTVSGGLIALHLLDYGVGYNGRLVTFDGNGSFLATISTDYEIVSMSACEDRLSVLRNDAVVMFDKELCEIRHSPAPASSAGAEGILALRDGAALVTSDHTAVILRAEDGDNGVYVDETGTSY